MSERKLTPFVDGEKNKKRKFEYNLEDEHSFSRFVYATSKEDALLLIQDRHPNEDPRSIDVRDVEEHFNNQKELCDKFFATYTKESFTRKVAEDYYKCLIDTLYYHDGLSQTSTCPPLCFYFEIDGFNLATIFSFVKKNKDLFSNEVLSFIEYFSSDETTRFSYEFRYKSLKRETLEGKKCLFVLESIESVWPNQKYKIGKVFTDGLFFDILSELKKIGQENGKIVNVCLGLAGYQVVDNNDFPDKYDEYGFGMDESPLPIYYASSKLYERYDLIEGNEFTIDASKHRSRLEQEMMQLVTPEFEIVIEISDEPVVRKKPEEPKPIEEPKHKKKTNKKDDSKFKAFLLSSVLILIPYSLFILSLVFLFKLHSGIMMSYQAPDGFVVLAVFSMMALIVGSSIMSPLDLTIKVVADIQTPAGAFEITEIGPGNYSVGERGSAGAGIIILKFIVNVIISPFMILYWVVVFILILFKEGFAKKYLNDIEEKGKAIASAVMLVGFILASIELGCVNARDKKYSPDKFLMETSSLVLTNIHYYRDDFVEDSYQFDITVSHPYLSQLENIEGQEAIILYNGEVLNDLTVSVRIPDYFYKRNETLYGDNKIHCTLSNIYKETGHEGSGYMGLDYYSFSNYVKISNLDKTKLEIHYKLRWVSFGQDQYSYIRTGWKDIDVKCNF